jgi:hypothetical protein
MRLPSPIWWRPNRRAGRGAPQAPRLRRGLAASLRLEGKGAPRRHAAGSVGLRPAVRRPLPARSHGRARRREAGSGGGQTRAKPTFAGKWPGERRRQKAEVVQADRQETDALARRAPPHRSDLRAFGEDPVDGPRGDLFAVDGLEHHLRDADLQGADESGSPLGPGRDLPDTRPLEPPLAGNEPRPLRPLLAATGPGRRTPSTLVAGFFPGARSRWSRAPSSRGNKPAPGGPPLRCGSADAACRPAPSPVFGAPSRPR